MFLRVVLYWHRYLGKGWLSPRDSQSGESSKSVKSRSSQYFSPKWYIKISYTKVIMLRRDYMKSVKFWERQLQQHKPPTTGAQLCRGSHNDTRATGTSSSTCHETTKWTAEGPPPPRPRPPTPRNKDQRKRRNGLRSNPTDSSTPEPPAIADRQEATTPPKTQARAVVLHAAPAKHKPGQICRWIKEDNQGNVRILGIRWLLQADWKTSIPTGFIPGKKGQHQPGHPHGEEHFPHYAVWLGQAGGH